MDLINNILTIGKSAGLTQLEIANRIGYTSSAISKFKTRSTVLSAEIIQRFKESLDAPDLPLAAGVLLD